MADRTARSLHRLRLDSESRPQLKLIAGALDAAPSGKATMLVAPAIAPAILSPSADLWGVSRRGWTAAAVLYVALGGALLIAAWQTTPPEPWPASQSVFKVVFEEPPPAPSPAPEPPQSAAPEVAPEPPVAETAPEPPPLPPLAIAEPTPQDLPKPPPAKPTPPRQHAAPPPRTATPAPIPPAPSPPAEQQVATTAMMAPPPLSSAPILPPQPISGLAGNRKPDYPASAKQRGQQGRVVLRVEVSAAGSPLSIVVASTSGYSALDKAALAAVEEWRFKPATQAGAAVAGAVDVPIQFRLEE